MVKIGFSTTDKLLSRVIRKITNASVSHCWFLFEAHGKEFVLQADIGGVRITPFTKWEKKWKSIQLIEPKVEIDLSSAWDMLDENYDYGGLIGNAWVYLGLLFKKKWKNPFENARSLFCSELVIKVLQTANYPGAAELNSSTTTPAQILELLTA